MRQIASQVADDDDDAAHHMQWKWIVCAILYECFYSTRTMLRLPFLQDARKTILEHNYDKVMRLDAEFHDRSNSTDTAHVAEISGAATDIFQALIFDVSTLLYDSGLSFY